MSLELEAMLRNGADECCKTKDECSTHGQRRPQTARRRSYSTRCAMLLVSCECLLEVGAGGCEAVNTDHSSTLK